MIALFVPEITSTVVFVLSIKRTSWTQASGKLLDAIGEKLNEKRGQADDRFYRIMLKSKIAARRGDAALFVPEITSTVVFVLSIKRTSWTRIPIATVFFMRRIK